MSISLAPAAASVRAAITNLFRRIDLAPAVWIIAGISFVVHVVFGNNYGYFRDELYLMAMSQHPGFGYVDVPPLVPWITLIPRFLTGNALWSLHVISALVCAGIILLTGLMARLLGGDGWVQGLAALASATALVLLAGGSNYTYDVFDQLWWALAATILILLLRDERPRRWLTFGVVAGLGLLTKETILFWGFALVAGLLLTRERRLLFTRWTLFGALIAVALFLPFVLWNAANDWASLQYWAGYPANHSGGGSPLDFVANQILVMNPLSVPLWVAGLVYFFSARGARYRVFAWAYLILFVLFIAISGKSYFLAPAYPPLYAGGAVLFGQWRCELARVGSASGHGLCRRAGAGWRTPGAGGDAGLVPRGVCPCLWLEQQWGVAAGFRRCLRLPTEPGGPLRLAGAGCLDRAGVSQPASGRAAGDVHLHLELRGGRRARRVRWRATTCPRPSAGTTPSISGGRMGVRVRCSSQSMCNRKMRRRRTIR